MGTLPTGHIRVSSTLTQNHWTKEPFEVDSIQNDRSKRKEAASLLVMQLIDTSLGAEPQKPGL